ncbi:hypothetical protein Glove_217g257 [Diversispora epigaea]|uniref:Uncharacterized protein n=1 Tax=Diversispora epigaea TaxID=1348612 RepID=A0A397IQF1_9GLOM|nr:hypothetical protein Glove_217g257 [Diversispora epigaea]
MAFKFLEKLSQDLLKLNDKDEYNLHCILVIDHLTSNKELTNIVPSDDKNNTKTTKQDISAQNSKLFSNVQMQITVNMNEISNKKQKICIEKDIQAIEAQVPLLNRIIANNALAEFRNNINCNSLRELTCAVCSGLFSFEHLSTVSVQEICLPLLEVNKYLEKPFFEIDFV